MLALPACDIISGSDPAGPPAGVEVVSGDLQTTSAGTELPQALVVVVTDDGGRPVRGLAVTWVVTAGGGGVLAGTTATGRDGRAQTSWTLGTAAGDTQRVEARAAGAGAATLSAEFRAVATPAAPASVVVVGEASRSGAPGETLADSLVVRVQDAYGNLVPGETVSFAASGGGAVSPATGTTGLDGTARTRWTLGTDLSAQQTVAAAVGTLPPAVFSAQMGLGGELSLAGGDGQSGFVGRVLADSLAVRFTTAAGEPIRGATVDWDVGGFGSATPVTSTTGADGVARTAWRMGTTPATRTATATLAGTEISVSFDATAVPGPAHELRITSFDGDWIRLGESVGVETQAMDPYRNPVPGAMVFWETDCGGPMTPASGPTDSDGRARTSWLVDEPGCDWYYGSATVEGVAPVLFGMIYPVAQTPFRVEVGFDSATVALPQEPALFDAWLYDVSGERVSHDAYCGKLSRSCYLFTWSTSNPAVASFGGSCNGNNDNGETCVTFHAPGTTVITARHAVYDDTQPDSIVITVIADGAVHAEGEGR